MTQRFETTQSPNQGLTVKELHRLLERRTDAIELIPPFMKIGNTGSDRVLEQSDESLLNGNLPQGEERHRPEPHRLTFDQQDEVVFDAIAEQGKEFFSNPDNEEEIDSIINKCMAGKGILLVNLNNFPEHFKIVISFLSDPNKLDQWYHQLVCPIECYARYFYAYTAEALDLLDILNKKDISKFEDDEYKKLLRAYLIIRSLMSSADSGAGSIDPAK